MRIHTDHLTFNQVINAAMDMQDVYIDVTRHGSRKRDHAFELSVSAEPRKGRRPRNSGNRGADEGEAAATWDEWGVIFARLFDIDPGMTCHAYDGAEHYHWSTGNRFRDPATLEMHDQHRWEYSGQAVTGSYHVSECKCGAIRRWLTSGTWTDFAEASWVTR